MTAVVGNERELSPLMTVVGGGAVALAVADGFCAWVSSLAGCEGGSALGLLDFAGTALGGLGEELGVTGLSWERGSRRVGAVLGATVAPLERGRVDVACVQLLPRIAWRR